MEWKVLWDLMVHRILLPVWPGFSAWRGAWPCVPYRRLLDPSSGGNAAQASQTSEPN